MPFDLRESGRWIHLACGFAAVSFGLIVMLLPKFGRRAKWHRHLGRIYALLIATSSALGIPLSYLRGSEYLMVLGTVTLAVVTLGWLAGRSARRWQRQGKFPQAEQRFRQHLILMGASYIGAWSGFFATNPIFGTGHEWQVWLYVFGPSVVGAFFILRILRRPSVQSSQSMVEP